jgi:hypothetical protein
MLLQEASFAAAIALSCQLLLKDNFVALISKRPGKTLRATGSHATHWQHCRAKGDAGKPAHEGRKGRRSNENHESHEGREDCREEDGHEGHEDGREEDGHAASEEHGGHEGDGVTVVTCLLACVVAIIAHVLHVLVFYCSVLLWGSRNTPQEKIVS